MCNDVSDDAWEKRLPAWTLVTSHGMTLLYVANHPDATVRQIAAGLQLTERRVADIIRELSDANFILVDRQGRKNYYHVNPDAHFRHPLLADIPFRGFMRLWRRGIERPRSSRKPPA